MAQQTLDTHSEGVIANILTILDLHAIYIAQEDACSEVTVQTFNDARVSVGISDCCVYLETMEFSPGVTHHFHAFLLYPALPHIGTMMMMTQFDKGILHIP